MSVPGQCRFVSDQDLRQLWKGRVPWGRPSSEDASLELAPDWDGPYERALLRTQNHKLISYLSVVPQVIPSQTNGAPGVCSGRSSTENLKSSFGQQRPLNCDVGLILSPFILRPDNHQPTGTNPSLPFLLAVCPLRMPFHSVENLVGILSIHFMFRLNLFVCKIEIKKTPKLF